MVSCITKQYNNNNSNNSSSSSNNNKINEKIQMLVEAISKQIDVIYTDDSVTRDQSGLGVTVKQGS